MSKDTRQWEKAQEGRELENRCWEYLKPLLEELHKKVDRRLVKTFLDVVVNDIYSVLDMEGLYPWMDRVDILPGEKWHKAIQRALEKSTGFVFCLSKNSSNPTRVLLWESRQARRKADGLPDDAIYFVPVRLDDCGYPGSIRKFQVVDWEGGNKKGELVRALREGFRRHRQKASMN